MFCGDFTNIKNGHGESVTAREIQNQLKLMRAYANENFVPVMKPDAQAKLAEVCGGAQPENILEIGTAIGFSGIVMLEAAPCARLNTIEINENRAAAAKENFQKAGMAGRLNIFLGDAKEIVREMTGEYGFIFMDGPKGAYLEFLPYLLGILKKGGVLFCDNVGYMGLTRLADRLPKRHKHITIARNMSKFVKEITSCGCLETEVFFEIGDGVSISRKIR